MSDELEKKEPGLEERFAKIDAILGDCDLQR